MVTTVDTARRQRVAERKLGLKYSILDRDDQPELPDDWETYAACRNLDPNIWFPQSEDCNGEHKNGPCQGDKARSICAECPVQQECLAYAIMAGEPYGIWGGKTTRQREQLRKAYSRWAQCVRCGRVYWRETPWRYCVACGKNRSVVT